MAGLRCLNLRLCFRFQFPKSLLHLNQISVSAGVELTCHLGGRLTVFHASASPSLFKKREK
ncbi:hypothetical protein KKF38_04115, partial [Patescibacteria group bacterium]|nr:hypothetical protein [Patescibacteria group bacterium]